MRVDSHLHIWLAAEKDTPGVRTIVPPQTPVPLDFACETFDEHGIDRAVFVQPVFRGEDNSYVADCAQTNSFRFAAVSVVDPCQPGAHERLAYWADRGCRGLRLRPRIAAEELVFGDPNTFPLWETAQAKGIVISLLSSPEHASTIGQLAQRYPGVSIVIDHLGHPAVEQGALSASFQNLLALARWPNVYLKTSGFYHFSRERFPYRDCWEFIRAAYDRFGPRRLLWGSDFPHVLLGCGYARSLSLPELALGAYSDADRNLIMSKNAIRLYWPAI